jgi:hypothetical protein
MQVLLIQQLNEESLPLTKHLPLLDLFVVPESTGGYGVYEERGSSTFSPGEDIELYTEPVGFSYKPIVANRTTQYLINFTADVVISDAEGNVVRGSRDLPAFEIISHHQNKEVDLTITVSQNPPFPEGNYKLLYRVYDKPSGNTYDIAKDITIAVSPNT